MADDKGIKLEISVDPDLGAVLVDRDKLEKIVLNLVFNALKFTPKDGRVELRVAKQEEDFALTVTDTGMGISQKNLPFVFDRFWQADGSSKRKYQGVGIGLSLVKELTEIQGGKVTVESQEGKGTKFTVRMPYLPAESAPQAEPVPKHRARTSSCRDSPKKLAASLGGMAGEFVSPRGTVSRPSTPSGNVSRPEISRNGDSPKCLVADDEPDMLRFLKSQLKSKFQVLEAVDGQQAVEKALANFPGSSFCWT